MSRFRKLSQTIWYCQYHIVWTPKYRFRILTGEIAQEVEACIRAFSEQQGCEVMELNVQIDHVHLLALISPESVSFGICWDGERENSHSNFQQVSQIERKTLLG